MKSRDWIHTLSVVLLRLLLLIGIFSYGVAQAQSYKLTVDILGLRSSDGGVYLSLYRSEDGYPKDPSKAFRKTRSTITNRKCTIIFDSIPKGTYALGSFHDENNNGKFDTNFLGIPLEGTGASNNAKGFLGPPSFKDAQFLLNKDKALAITISY